MDTEDAGRPVSCCSCLCLPVTFQDCSRGKVRFEMGPSADFRVSEAGEIYTSRPLSLGRDRAVEAVVYAQDLHTKQVWKTKFFLLAKSQQVSRKLCFPFFLYRLLGVFMSRQDCFYSDG